MTTKFTAIIPLPGLQILAERFWQKVDVRGPDECWPWTGGTARHGYGTFWVGGGKLAVASRFSLELHTGKPIPPGLFVLHKCDNPPCVNPSHLWAGTQKENMQDAKAKGRAVVAMTVARNHYAYRTHCKRGHEFTEATVYRHGPNKKWKRCTICFNDNQRRLRAERLKVRNEIHVSN